MLIGWYDLFDDQLFFIYDDENLIGNWMYRRHMAKPRVISSSVPVNAKHTNDILSDAQSRKLNAERTFDVINDGDVTSPMLTTSTYARWSRPWHPASSWSIHSWDSIMLVAARCVFDGSKISWFLRFIYSFHLAVKLSNRLSFTIEDM